MRKKSAKKVAIDFVSKAEEIEKFIDPSNLTNLSEKHITWAHEYAIIRLYREFERMILHSLIAAINNNSSYLSQKTGVSFPLHLKDEVCEYIIVGNKYFDFKGRDGLINKLKKFIPDNHDLVSIIKKRKYKKYLEHLSALRNFAAHDSKPSKKTALKVVDQQRMGSSGAWLKTNKRYNNISARLKDLAREIENWAPY